MAKMNKEISWFTLINPDNSFNYLYILSVKALYYMVFGLAWAKLNLTLSACMYSYGFEEGVSRFALPCSKLTSSFEHHLPND